MEGWRERTQEEGEEREDTTISTSTHTLKER